MHWLWRWNQLPEKTFGLPPWMSPLQPQHHHDLLEYFVFIRIIYIADTYKGGKPMNAKLTLSLDRDIIERAKVFSRSHHKSLSKLIEGYLRHVVHGDEAAKEATTLVARLSGVIDATKMGNRKGEYADYLTEKYR